MVDNLTSRLRSSMKYTSLLTTLYPLLSKTCSSKQDNTSSYHYSSLIKSSFEGSESGYSGCDVSQFLVEYFVDRLKHKSVITNFLSNSKLDRSNEIGLLRTLSTMMRLVESGSKSFRANLREKGDVTLKDLEKFHSVSQQTSLGFQTAQSQLDTKDYGIEIRSLAKSIRKLLYDVDVMKKDDDLSVKEEFRSEKFGLVPIEDSEQHTGNVSYGIGSKLVGLLDHLLVDTSAKDKSDAMTDCLNESRDFDSEKLRKYFIGSLTSSNENCGDKS